MKNIKTQVRLDLSARHVPGLVLPTADIPVSPWLVAPGHVMTTADILVRPLLTGPGFELPTTVTDVHVKYSMKS